MFRSHTSGELRIDHLNQEVTLCGWVQRVRDIDRHAVGRSPGSVRYYLTSLEENIISAILLENARNLGRKFVIAATGTVLERIFETIKSLRVI